MDSFAMLRLLPRFRRLAGLIEPLQEVQSQSTQVAQKAQLHTRLIARPFFYNSIRKKVWISKLELPKDDRTMDIAIYDALEKHIAADPTHVAIAYAGDPKLSLTFLELKKTMETLEIFLYNIGFKKGDVASILLPNCCEYPVILGAVFARGGVASTAAPTLTEYEIKLLLQDNESKVIFVADMFLPNVIAAAKNNKNIQTVVAISFTESPIPTGIISWKTAMEAKGSAPKVKISPNDLAVLPFSSGTTGVPKGVQLTHRNLFAAIRGVLTHIEKEVVPNVYPGISEADAKKKMTTPVILFLPFYHIFGLGLLLAKVISGSTVAQLPKFDPVIFLKGLMTFKPWELALVPPVAAFLARHPAASKVDLSFIKWILNGAAPLPEQVGLGLQKRIKDVNVTQGYGLTETAALTTFPSSMKAITSVGIPATGMQIKILDKSGKELGTNERGEIVVSGENVMKGYHKNVEETNKTLRNGWFHTGDIGYFDEENHLHVVDRIKELIKVKGLQVAPALLEAQLAKNPRIADAAVIGVEHEEFGEAPRAYVVKADPNLTEEEVKKTIADKLAKHNWLEGGVVFVKEIPKSPAGKILRRILKEMPQ